MPRWFNHNLRWKLISLLIAISVWVYINYELMESGELEMFREHRNKYLSISPQGSPQFYETWR